MFDGGTKARPESPARDNFIVIGAGVVIGAYGSTGSQVALALKAGGYEEGIVVVLLVGRENEVVENLAAGYGAVVAEHGVNHPRAVFEVAVGADYELDGGASVENAAAVTHDSVDQNHVLPNLGRFLLGRVDGYVLELACALDVAARAYLHILDDLGSLDHTTVAYGTVVAAPVVLLGLGHLLEAALQRAVVAIPGPEIRVCRDHTVKRVDAAAACLVHHLELYSHSFLLPVLYDSIAEFGVVGGTHFLDVEEHTTVAYYVVAQVVHVVDGAIVTYIAGVDGGVCDAYRQTQIVELKSVV